VTLALFPAGWHWPVVIVTVIAALTVVCVIAAGKSEREWLGDHRERLKRVAWIAVGLVVLAVLATQFHKVGGMLRRIEHGDPLWLALGVAIEAFSFIGYVVLTKEIFGPHAPRLSWPAATEITFGGVVATRLFSAAGAGGIAFTAWALRAAGMATRTAAQMIAAFLAIMYLPYVLACLLGGLLGGVPDAVMWVGVGLGVVTLLAAAALTLIPGDLERRARKLATGHGRMARIAARAASIPTVAGEAARTAASLLRRRPALLGWALLWWGADVAVLAVCFRAFGQTPALGALVLGYFLGHVGNLVPVPGGIGGVEGGMVGVFVACGMPLSLAIVGTIAYQLISTWLPVAPGLAAYWSLRRRIARWRAEDGVADEPTLARGAPRPSGAPASALDRAR
jgi:uncharacterized membrane protein YbhN (UPF0104 family)